MRTGRTVWKSLPSRCGILLCLGGLIGIQTTLAWSQAPPQKLTRSKLQEINSESEVIDGAFPGLLVIPHVASNYRDEKYNRPYHLACHVYAALPSRAGSTEPSYGRRFLVCAMDEASMALTKQVSKLLLLLYEERRDRIHDDHPENQPTVNVWLTEKVEPGLSPDTGGEQFQNQIYIYNIHRDRPPIEWAREIAHEYGHYALPGISGFRSPEEWANGVLGERLFLKWIRDDLKTARIHDENVPIVTGALLDDYYARTIWPLIRRILREGMDARLITRTNAEGMDYYTGLAMYVDTLYGSGVLVSAIADTQSASSLTFPRASDFLTGVLKALREEAAFTLNLPALGDVERETFIHFYLPAGSWSVGVQGTALAWKIAADPRAGIVSSPKSVRARKGGWYRLAYLRVPGATSAQLTFRKHG